MAEIVTTTDTQAEWQTGILEGVTATVAGNLELTEAISQPSIGVLEFDGDDYVDLGAVNFNTPELTFECKMKITDDSTNRGVLSWGAWDNPLSWYPRAGSTEYSAVGDTSGRAEGGWKVPLNTQVTASVIFSTIEGSIKVYVDGALVGTTYNIASDGSDLPMSGNLLLGVLLDTSYFVGTIGDIRFWNTARTQQQIQDNLFTTLTGTEPNLVAFYPCTEGSGTTLIDHAGTNDGTIYGAGWGSVPLNFTASGYYMEIFETSLGDWYNNASFSGWVRDSDGTPSADTGPTEGLYGTYYAYVESSDGDSFSAGNEDVLQYDSISDPVVSVRFYRHRYGTDQGTLYLEGYTGTAWEELAHWTGDEGNQWIFSEIACSHQSVRFRNVAAGGFLGDVALDGISVVLGSGISASYRESSPVDISSLGTAGRHNKVEWTATYNGETIIMEVALSDDGGTTWGNWISVANGESIAELALKDLSTYQIKTRQTLSTTTDGVTPQLHSMTLTVYDIVLDEFVVQDSIVLAGEPFPADVPHKLAGQTLLDGSPVRRRVEVRKRRTGDYVISTVTQDDGVFEFRRLPEQASGDPHIVTIFNDDSSSPTQSISLDYVYQVDENGNPPTGVE